jgi:hypothetical protein
MKVITHQQLWATPELWHRAMQTGTFNGVTVTVPDDFPADPPPAPPRRLNLVMQPAADPAAAEKVCAGCEWNIDWVCQHVGCQPCKQVKAGGLKAMLATPGYQCPAGKW